MGGKSSPPDMKMTDMLFWSGLQEEKQRDMFREATTANRPEQITPYGSTVWEELGDNKWRQTVELDPEAQRALDAMQTLGAERAEAAGNLFGTAVEDLEAPIGWEALSANPLDTGEEARNRAEEAIYGRATSRLDPRFEQRRERAETQLWNQGLRPGDAAYDTAMANLGREETDAYQAAMNEAIARGGAEGSRTFGMDLQRRQQALAEQLRRRTQALGEVNALASGQTPDMPTFNQNFAMRGTGTAPNYVDMYLADKGAAMDRWSANQAQKQGTMSGIAGLAGAAAPFFF